MKKASVIRTCISLVPIVVLVILLALNITIFGSDAILGASQVALLFSAGICVWLAMWLFKKPWEDRRHLRNMDNERNRAVPYILWCADHLPENLPGDSMYNLRLHFRDDRQFVDYHRDHRRCAHGYRQGTGLQCGIHLRVSPLQAHQVPYAHHSTIICSNIDNFLGAGFSAHRQRLRTDYGLYGDIVVEVQYFTVDAHRPGRDRNPHRQENACAAGIGNINVTGGRLRHRSPTAHRDGDRQPDSRGLRNRRNTVQG